MYIFKEAYNGTYIYALHRSSNAKGVRTAQPLPLLGIRKRARRVGIYVYIYYIYILYMYTYIRYIYYIYILYIYIM